MLGSISVLNHSSNKPPPLTPNPTYAIHWHGGEQVKMEIVSAYGSRVMRFCIPKQLMVDLLLESKKEGCRFEFYNRDSGYQQIRVFENV